MPTAARPSMPFLVPMTRPASPPPPDDDSAQDFPLARMLARAKPATKAERTFQQLVGTIARTRSELKEWQAYELRYNQRLVDEIDPLRAKLHTHQRRMVTLIDDMLSRPAASRSLVRTERAKLSQMLVELVRGLLYDGGDDALEALHDKYSEVSRAQMRRSEMELAQSMLSEVFGLDIGDDHGATTPEELLEHARRQTAERADANERLTQDLRNPSEDGPGATASAAQARREQAAREVSQSLREIYRKLASALHPDREQDPEARQRKTSMMQRVNQAYDASDLLALLALQLEIEQIDAAHLSSVTPKRLAHYNKVLREQLAELEAELARHVGPFRRSVGLPENVALTPAAVDKHMSTSVKQLRAAIRQLRADLDAFRDPAWVREMLKHYTLDAERDDGRDVDELAERFTDLAPQARGNARRRR